MNGTLDLDLACDVSRRDGVTLVACRVRNPADVPCRVRIANELDGPVLPPRRRGTPVTGWDLDGCTLRVPANAARAVGYACPSDPPGTEPPAAIERVERDAGADDAGRTGIGDETDAETVVRDLGAYRPPRAAVPTPVDDRSPPSVGEPPDRENANPRAGPRTPTGRGDAADAGGLTAPVDGMGCESPTGTAVAVEAWLDGVARRIERGERLDGSDVATATEVVTAVGGLEAVADLESRLDEDAVRLRSFAKRATALAERADRTDVPTGALGRLA